MAIQIGDSADSSSVYALERHRVLMRGTWSAPWQTAQYVSFTDATLAVAPSVSTASLRFEAGRIKREDISAFVSYSAMGLLNRFVRIERLDAFGTALPLWTGIIKEQSYAPGGGSSGLADQEFTAYGLEYLLGRRTFRSSVVHDPIEDELVTIPHAMSFNGRDCHGLSEIGNRSWQKYEAGGGYFAYAFARDGQPWSVADILEYLIFRGGPTDVRFTIAIATNLYDYLKKTIPPRYTVEGKSLLDVLNELLDRRLGLGWYLQVSGQTVEIVIFSTLGEAAGIGDATVPANPSQVTLNPAAFGHRIKNVRMTGDAMGRYGKVIVQGNRLISIFSLAYTSDPEDPPGLRKGWSDADEAGYLEPIPPTIGGDGESESAALDKKDEARASDAWRRVYQSHLVDPNFTFISESGKFAVPYFDPQNGKVHPDYPGISKAFDHTFLSVLPGLSEVAPTVDPANPTATPIAANTDYRPMLAVARRPASLSEAQAPDVPYVMLDRQRDISCGRLRPLDTAWGIELGSSPNHLMALGTFPATGASSYAPAIDYRTMIVTVAMETDERVRIEATIPGGDPDQEKVIDVEDAHLFYIVAGTVIDVNGDGTLKRHEGGELRNDAKDRLRRIAALAKAWYGTVRTTLSFSLEYLGPEFSRGTYITGTVGPLGTQPVNSVVTQITYDASGRTTYRTNWCEIDVAAGGRAKDAGRS